MASGKEQKAVAEALAASFTTSLDLAMFLLQDLERPAEGIPQDDTPPSLPKVQLLVRRAATDGWYEALVQQLRAAKPDAPAVRRLEEFFGVRAALRLDGLKGDDRPERIIREDLGFLGLAAMIEGFRRIRRTLCRIDIEGKPEGSGFLVGHDLVLTCHHVVEDQLPIGGSPGDGTLIRVRWVADNGAGEERVDLASDWLVASSVYDPATQMARGQLGVDGLDYALLRLARPIGYERLDGAPRGFLREDVQDRPYDTDKPVLIAQHPQGREQELAIETRGVIAMNAQQTRLRYRTNTEPGSSGAPVFDGSLRLIAMHASGANHANSGVPIGTILRDLQQMPAAWAALVASRRPQAPAERSAPPRDAVPTAKPGDDPSERLERQGLSRNQGEEAGSGAGTSGDAPAPSPRKSNPPPQQWTTPPPWILGGMALLGSVAVIGVLVRACGAPDAPPPDPLEAGVDARVDVPTEATREDTGALSDRPVVRAPTAQDVSAGEVPSAPSPNYAVQVFRETALTPERDVRVQVHEIMSGHAHDRTTDRLGFARFRLSNLDLLQIVLLLDREGACETTVLPPWEGQRLPALNPVDLSRIPRDHWRRCSPGRQPDAPTVRVATTSRSALLPVTNTRVLLGTPTFAPTHLPWGRPAAELTIARQSYVVGFDPRRKLPRWVAYRIQPGPMRPRSRTMFRPDPLLPVEQQADESTYRGNGYDRGHLVSRADVFGLPSTAEAEINLLSVVVPQVDIVNQRTWAAVENLSREEATRSAVWVIAGPIYNPAARGVTVTLALLGNDVAVPTHYFRVMIRRDPSGHLDAIGYMIPNSFSAAADPARYRTPLREIERASSLSLFPSMPAAQRAGLERPNTRLWGR